MITESQGDATLLQCSNGPEKNCRSKEALRAVGDYRCRIHPFALCGDLDEQAWREICQSILLVIRSSYAKQRPFVSTGDEGEVRYREGRWREVLTDDMTRRAQTVVAQTYT
jgi:hypothetical protein